MSCKNGILFLVGAIVIAGALLFANRETAEGQGGKGGMGGSGAAYTVVQTDGAHLIVTDNKANTLYFYTIDKDGKIGDDLKLRGRLDLTAVGQPSLKPIDAKPQK